MTLLLPWKVLRQREGNDFLEIADETGLRQIAEVGGAAREERAAFIVTACNSHASLRARVEELEKALKTGAIELERITKWLERLSVVAERQAKDTRFQTLADANAADARNYRNTIKSIEPALTAARAALNTGEGE